MKKAALTILMLATFSYLSCANIKDMGKLINLTGKTFGRLTVISRNGYNHHHIKWLCRCSCGNETSVRAGHLTQGLTISCGCYKPGSPIHNHSGRSGTTREYSSWMHMRGRCNNPKSRAYKSYGAKGISVCSDWINSFPNFLKDMGLAPSQKHSIDRIDVFGNYEKSNCRWATNHEQANNKRNTVIVFYKGENRPLSPLCNELGLPRSVIGMRLLKGWPLDKALNYPIKRKIIKA